MLLQQLRSMVFVATHACAMIVAERLIELGVKAAPYHGAMSDKELVAVWEWWRTTPNAVLVSTSLAGTGRNEPSVTFVAHMTLRARIEEMVQEWGRAGQAAICWIAFHPLLLDKLAYFVDFEDSTMVGLLMDVLGLVAMHAGCRRQRMQLLLGDETHTSLVCPACVEGGHQGVGGGGGGVGGGGGGAGGDVDAMDVATEAEVPVHGTCDLCCDSAAGMPKASDIRLMNMAAEEKALLEDLGSDGKSLPAALRSKAWRASLTPCEANSLFVEVLLHRVEWFQRINGEYTGENGKKRTSKQLCIRTDRARSAEVLTNRSSVPVVVWTQRGATDLEGDLQDDLDDLEGDLDFAKLEIESRGTWEGLMDFVESDTEELAGVAAAAEVPVAAGVAGASVL